MKSIALIHTVQSLAISFSKQLQDFLQEDVKIHNIWDDFLANNPNEIGKFSLENKNRLFYIVKAAELTNADLIVTTCSTLTPTIKEIRSFIKIPIIAIDDAITKKAAVEGNNILILATAESALKATKEKIQEAYGLIHKIYEGFKVVADKESDKAPSIQNAEQIYAGLTYGRENITETTMQDYNRGFKA